jgi:hypothetical protein
MSYITLRCCWCDIIILNVQAPTEDKIDDIKDRFYEEVEHVFDKFPAFFSFGAAAPIWALGYLHETLSFTSVY